MKGNDSRAEHRPTWRGETKLMPPWAVFIQMKFILDQEPVLSCGSADAILQLQTGGLHLTWKQVFDGECWGFKLTLDLIYARGGCCKNECSWRQGTLSHQELWRMQRKQWMVSRPCLWTRMYSVRLGRVE